VGDVKDAVQRYEERYQHVSRKQTADRGVSRCCVMADAAIAQLQEANAALASKNVHLIAEAARNLKRAEAAEAVSQSVIPPRWQLWAFGAGYAALCVIVVVWEAAS